MYRNLYAEGLVSELTTFAAFTALVVFIPAVAAVAIGRWLVDRKRPPFVRRRITDDQTDVFDAVRDDDAKTGPIPGLAGGSAAAAEEHTPPSRRRARRRGPQELARAPAPPHRPGTGESRPNCSSDQWSMLTSASSVSQLAGVLGAS